MYFRKRLSVVEHKLNMMFQLIEEHNQQQNVQFQPTIPTYSSETPLPTVMEKLIENISFTAPERKGEKIKIKSKQVKEEVGKLAKDTDLSKFIL